ncbi:MAG: nickel pincer cofactor biosynthesis protein LarC [Lentisphaeria bacterium]|nr:nickel pincer cofactor biosynthesis protein LarC [Lentisphaeria bacterium]
MKILRLDSVGGASGDMLLGVFFALGVEPEKLQHALAGLLPEPFSLRADAVCENGITGIRASVELAEPEGHCHRTLADIRKILQDSSLPEAVKEQAVGVFTLLAEAEGKIHGKLPEEVAFHEVGAVDSIVDIAGCCLAWPWLGLDALELSPLPLGHGVMRCAHGIMPIPAPATALLFQSCQLPAAADDEPFELVTPTGAALLGYWPKTIPRGQHVIAATGNSFGKRRLLNRPNLLRGMILEESSGNGGDTVWELECDVDDTTPEILGAAAAELLTAGALDVTQTPVFMKKQRSGTRLSLLVRPEDREAFLRRIFALTSTFGIRERQVKRSILHRRLETVSTPYGAVKIKIGSWKGEDLTASPEFSDCQRLAEESGVSVKLIYAEAQGVAAKIIQNDGQITGK